MEAYEHGKMFGDFQTYRMENGLKNVNIRQVISALYGLSHGLYWYRSDI
jgi:hypothetical protein